MIDAETVAIIGVVLGVILNTAFPYLKKMEQTLAEGEEIQFEKKYIVSAIIAMIVTSISAMWAVTQFGDVSGTDGQLSIFIGALFYGAMGNYITNIPVDWLRERAENL